MPMTETPSLEEFLNAPASEVARVAPMTMVSAVGGTRRDAAFAIGASSIKEYAQFGIAKMTTCLELFFSHGVQHVLINAITPGQMRETNREFSSGAWMSLAQTLLTSPEMLADWQRLGCRVRLIGAESIPALRATSLRLRELTPQTEGPTLWVQAVVDENDPWKELMAAVLRSQAQTRQDAIRALYGEDIPPATLFLGSGKPQVFNSLVPPLLMGHLQCYWLQRPGYNIDKDVLRTIFYDYAFMRKTWRADKSGRLQAALRDRAQWQKAPILGLGTNLGPFWYPAPIAQLATDKITGTEGDEEYAN